LILCCHTPGLHGLLAHFPNRAGTNFFFQQILWCYFERLPDNGSTMLEIYLHFLGEQKFHYMTISIWTKLNGPFLSKPDATGK
jgi:hypothetical protein